MAIDLNSTLIYNQKSIDYARICLHTAWQIATAGYFDELFERNGGRYEKILYLEKRSNFVHQIVFTNWRMFVIEVCKLFDKNSSQSIQKLINKLLHKEQGFKLVNYNREKLEIINNKFKDQLESNQGLFERIKHLRDKFYAHRDDEFYTQLDIEVKFNEGNVILEIAKNTLVEIAEFCNERVVFIDSEGLFKKTGVKELIFLSEQQ
ncbi:hypothetical protein [Sphingobacterium sp. xlx-130]|uniref:AbiU2 domain-containing protein n=1 Tax=Sphingobacterium sp. xlx-130 TaxID=2654323 RepID=UPI0013DC0475|nr:hypothetical protein [Sphingobacterium sp. xlx-130]